MKKELHRHTVSRRFSSAAATYHALASVQKAVGHNLVRLLSTAGNPERILEAGCGTGILTMALLHRFPNAHLDAIDLSPAMLAEARRIFPREERITWIAADAVHYRGAVPYDLIVSNCALHWIDPLLEGLYNLVAQLRPGGRLIFSIMLHGTLDELHSARLRVAPHKPPQGRLPRINEVADSLELCGARILESTEEIQTGAYPSATEMLRILHDLGLTGGAISQAAVPLNRSEIARLIADYDTHYAGENGGVTASYKVGYFIADKPAP